ncbi:MAG TPA: SPASM domain-containing protein, partial [Spirochaetia bacterium]|nr:SPASM domain-containing protein [Spirochaetia bacterium]
ASPIFKTQLGRNYELHTCQADSGRLFSRVELYEKLLEMIAKHPEILELHKPAFSLSKFLWENGELPTPLFDSCPGCKTEWAFDFTGRIYACTATVGKEGEELGTFHPLVGRREGLIREWQERDVTSIAQCRDCSLQLACGGGCAAVARNHAGNLRAPDCRPVKELLEMGMSLYFGKEET